MPGGRPARCVPVHGEPGTVHHAPLVRHLGIEECDERLERFAQIARRPGRRFPGSQCRRRVPHTRAVKELQQCSRLPLGMHQVHDQDVAFSFAGIGGTPVMTGHTRKDGQHRRQPTQAAQGRNSIRRFCHALRGHISPTF